MPSSRYSPESRARSLLRNLYGYEVESVNWVRAQHEGEFMCIVEPLGADEGAIRFLLGMETGSPDVSQTFEITRIHVGTHAVRIYLRWAA